MSFGHLFSGINWLAVIVATVSAFTLGGLWYSKALFGNCWMQEVGLTEEIIAKTKMKPVFAGTFLLQFIAATTLAKFLGTDSSWLIGLISGLLIGFCWVATAYGITYLFEQRSLRLFMINAGYFVVLFAITGTIIGVWP